MELTKTFLRQQGLTARQWKAQKRRELKEVIRAFDAYRMGCAFTPNYKDGDVEQIEKALFRIRQSISAKAWGR